MNIWGSDLKCMVCNSENLRKFSVVYDEGTTTGELRRLGDHAFFGASHFSQTALAEKCSPPARPTPSVVTSATGLILSIVLSVKVGAYLGSILWGLATLAILIGGLFYLWRRVLAKNRFLRFHRNYAEWERSWVCLKCGAEFATREASRQTISGDQ